MFAKFCGESSPGMPSLPNALPLLSFFVTLATSSAVIGVSRGLASYFHRSIGVLQSSWLKKRAVEFLYHWQELFCVVNFVVTFVQ